MNRPTHRHRSLPLLLATLVATLAMAACGDDDSSTDDTSAAAGESTTATTSTDPATVAEQLAECTTAAGLEGNVVDGEEASAAGVDLTTENATIVVQVFPSPEEAAAYESASGLDQEQVDAIVILGGAIPAKARATIGNCLPDA